MGVEAARLALRAAPGGHARRARGSRPCTPAYVDKTNATAIHAALRLDTDVAALDFGGAVRSASARCAPRSRGAGTTLVVAADIRTGLPGSGDEAAGGDGAAALLVGDDDSASGARRAPRRRQRDRGVRRPLAHAGRRALQALGGALRRDRVRAARRAGLERGAEGRRELSADQVDRLIVTGLHARAVRSLAGKLGATNAKPVDDLRGDRRQHRRRPPGSAADRRARDRRARPGHRARRARRRRRRAAVPHDRRRSPSYRPAQPGRRPGRRRRARAATASSSRGAAMVTLEPPRRPEPPRVVVVRGGAQRGVEVRVRRLARPRDRRASTCRRSGSRSTAHGSTTMEAVPMADVAGTIATFTDRPHGVLAEPAGGVRRRRLRRRRPAPGRAHRRRRRRRRDRQARRDDLPPAVHRRRDPQLLLEGPPRPLTDPEESWTCPPTASRTGSRSSGWAARRSSSTGTRALDDLADRRGRGDASRRPASTRTTSTRTGSAPRRRGMSGITLARPLQLDDKPVTRVENFCATGIRGAAPGRVRGGVGRLRRRDGRRRREGEGQRLPGPQRRPAAQRRHRPHAHRGRDVRDGRARVRQQVRRRPTTQLREVLARIAWKNHYNGARNPRAQFRREVSMETICGVAAASPATSACSTARASPTAPRPRSSCAPRTRTGTPTSRCTSRRCRSSPATARARSTPTYDYTTFPEIVAARDATRTSRPASPTRAHELAMAEVHDCFTPTELVLMEDLGFAERGTAWKEVLAGTFDLDGELPVNPDGGLKSFGHPVGASGLRMMFEAGCSCAARPRPSARSRASARPQAARADPQPRRLPRRDGQLRQHPRHRTRLTPPQPQPQPPGVLPLFLPPRWISVGTGEGEGEG